VVIDIGEATKIVSPLGLSNSRDFAECLINKDREANCALGTGHPLDKFILRQPFKREIVDSFTGECIEPWEKFLMKCIKSGKDSDYALISKSPQSIPRSYINAVNSSLQKRQCI